MNAVIMHNADIQKTELGGGVSRKVLAYDERMMVVEVIFETGGVGSVHTHPHAQSTYVKSGKFRFTISGEPVFVSAGDSIVFQPDVAHGALCLEAGTLVDIFTPMREDFI